MLKHIIAGLKQRHGASVAVTAASGIAATVIDGALRSASLGWMVSNCVRAAMLWSVAKQPESPCAACLSAAFKDVYALCEDDTQL